MQKTHSQSLICRGGDREKQCGDVVGTGINIWVRGGDLDKKIVSVSLSNFQPNSFSLLHPPNHVAFSKPFPSSDSSP